VKREELKLRTGLVEKARWMNASGLNQGTSGNISARYGDGILITPSGVPYDQMLPEMIAVMPIEGEYGAWSGPMKPSSEWRFHLDIARARPDVGSVVHTHSTFATAVAINRRSIPAVHYMMAAFGGTEIRCAEYATFGTEDQSRSALHALEGCAACLLANHGMIATGNDLDRAMWLAVETETIARQYFYAEMLGKPVVLNETQIDATRQRFSTYGQGTPDQPKKRPAARKAIKAKAAPRPAGKAKRRRA
jgi:L-fuculose-phosphate aldolase